MQVGGYVDACTELHLSNSAGATVELDRRRRPIHLAAVIRRWAVCSSSVRRQVTTMLVLDWVGTVPAGANGRSRPKADVRIPECHWDSVTQNRPSHATSTQRRR
jgi:hypothetical protein